MLLVPFGGLVVRSVTDKIVPFLVLTTELRICYY